MLSKIYPKSNPSDVIFIDFVALSRPTIVVHHESEGLIAKIDIETGDIVDGSLRPSVHMSVCEWIEKYREAIAVAWKVWSSGKTPEQIPGEAAA